MPEWQRLGWPDEKSWIDAGRPNMSPAEWLNTPEAATGGATTEEDKPDKSDARLLYHAGLVTREQLVGWFGESATAVMLARPLSENDQEIVRNIRGETAPEERGQITPPSLTGGAGLAERLVQGSRGEWYVVNRAGETLGGPYSTKEAAENELENIQLGITKPLTAGGGGTGGTAPGPSSGGGAVREPDPTAGMTPEQKAAFKFDQAQAQTRAALDQARAEYESQGMIVTDLGDGKTLRVSDPSTGRVFNAQYIPSRGRVETSQAVMDTRIAQGPGGIRFVTNPTAAAGITPLGGTDEPSLAKAVLASSGEVAVWDAFKAAHGRYPTLSEAVIWLDSLPGRGVSSISKFPDPRRERNLDIFMQTGGRFLFDNPMDQRATALTARGQTLGDLPPNVRFASEAQALFDLWGQPIEPARLETFTNEAGQVNQRVIPGVYPDRPRTLPADTQRLLESGPQSLVLNPETGNMMVNRGIDPATGETRYEELTGSDAYFAANEMAGDGTTLDPVGDSGIGGMGRDRGYRIVADPAGGFMIVGPDGEVRMSGLASLSQAQMRADLIANRERVQGLERRNDMMTGGATAAVEALHARGSTGGTIRREPDLTPDLTPDQGGGAEPRRPREPDVIEAPPPPPPVPEPIPPVLPPLPPPPQTRTYPIFGFNQGGRVMGGLSSAFHQSGAGGRPTMMVNEEIIGVGAQTGRPHFMLNEGTDGLGGQVVPELLTIEPMGGAGTADPVELLSLERIRRRRPNTLLAGLPMPRGGLSGVR